MNGSAVTPRRLRIAVLNRVFSPTGGGAERYSIALVEQLADRHDFHVFAQKIDHQWPGVTYHQIPAFFTKPRWLNQLWYAAATWLATRKGFDVVHSHENTWHGNVQTMHVMPVKFNLFHGLHGWRKGLRYVKVAASPRLLVYLMFERSRLSGTAGRNCVVAASLNLQQSLLSTYPDSEPLLKVISPGVHLPKLERKMGKPEARQSLGLPTTGRCLLFVGHDYKKKGLEALLRALALLPNDVFLAVVGNSAQRPTFNELALSLGIVGKVHFLGLMPDVTLAYEAADVLVHPTLEDTFAMVVIEAMANDLPVVVSGSRYCGVSSLLTNRMNAILLEDPKDVKQLSAEIAQVLAEPDYRLQLIAAGKTFALEHQWSLVAQRQEAVYFAVSNNADTGASGGGVSRKPS